MRRNRYCPMMLLLSVVAFAAVSLAQPMQQNMAETQERFNAWVTAINKFVGVVRFNEGDLRSFLDNWESFSEFGENVERGWEEDSDEPPDFAKLLADPDYRRWASQAGVNPEDWLRKSMRIVATTVREEVLTAMQEAEAQIPAQMEMMKGQRSQMGDETYEQMMRAMETSLASMKMMKEAASKLTKASADEEKLLKEHGPEMEEVMGGERDEDW